MADTDEKVVDAQIMYPPEEVPHPSPFGEKLYTLHDLYTLPNLDDWLVTNLFCRGELVVLFGDGGSGKSYVAIDLVMALASGYSWCAGKFEITQPRQVVYTVGEGWRGIRKRFFALESEYLRKEIPTQPENIRPVPYTPQLFEEKSSYAPEEFLRFLRQHDCPNPDVIVIDTLQRATIAANENDSKDVGIILGNLTTIQRETGACIILVHHANKLGGIRGNTALRNSADIVLGVQKLSENSHVLKCDKVKDADYFEPIPFYFYAMEESSVIQWQPEKKVVAAGTDSEKVLTFLNAHPDLAFNATQIAFATGILYNHVSRAIKNLENIKTSRENPDLPGSKSNQLLYQIREVSE